jgi:hypothetical protein
MYRYAKPGTAASTLAEGEAVGGGCRPLVLNQSQQVWCCCRCCQNIVSESVWRLNVT